MCEVDYIEEHPGLHYGLAENGYERIKMCLDHDSRLDLVHIEWVGRNLSEITKEACTFLCERLNGKPLRETMGFSQFEMLRIQGDVGCILLPWFALQQCILRINHDPRRTNR